MASSVAPHVSSGRALVFQARTIYRHLTPYWGGYTLASVAHGPSTGINNGIWNSNGLAPPNMPPHRELGDASNRLETTSPAFRHVSRRSLIAWIIQHHQRSSLRRFSSSAVDPAIAWRPKYVRGLLRPSAFRARSITHVSATDFGRYASPSYPFHRLPPSAVQSPVPSHDVDPSAWVPQC